MPFITVVTVTYNCEDLIDKTILSVCRLDYQNKEYIIIDGGSSDNTVSIIQSYAQCVTRFVSEKDSGIYDAMNKGVSLCSPKSDYIIFLNAGDVFASSNVFTEMVEHMTSVNTHYYGNVIRDGKIILSPSNITYFALSTSMVCHQEIFFKTKAIRQFPYDIKLRLCSDYKLILVLLESGYNFKKIDIIVSHYDVSGVSSTNRKLLHSEKNIIRQQFFKVYFWFIIKKSFKCLANIINN